MSSFPKYRIVEVLVDDKMRIDNTSIEVMWTNESKKEKSNFYPGLYGGAKLCKTGDVLYQAQELCWILARFFQFRPTKQYVPLSRANEKFLFHEKIETARNEIKRAAINLLNKEPTVVEEYELTEFFNSKQKKKKG